MFCSRMRLRPKKSHKAMTLFHGFHSLHLKSIDGIQSVLINRKFLANQSQCAECTMHFDTSRSCSRSGSTHFRDWVVTPLLSLSSPGHVFKGRFPHEKFYIFPPKRLTWFALNQMCQKMRSSVLRFHSPFEEEMFLTQLSKWSLIKDDVEGKIAIEYLPLTFFLGIHRVSQVGINLFCINND